MTKFAKISVLVPTVEARRFNAYCAETGHKKSTLIVRLIREHLEKEQFGLQGLLYELAEPKAPEAAAEEH